jgi:AcrR family transcriptional regulator
VEEQVTSSAPTEDRELFEAIKPAPARRLLLAALASFAGQGFYAATTRDIAKRAKMSPAAVYIHYSTKQDLLMAIIHVGHRSALEAIQLTLNGNDSPTARLAKVVRELVLWHAKYHLTARVSQYELAALSPENFKVIATLRRETEQVMTQTIQAGVDSGDFDTSDPAAAAGAILSLAIDVARWYPSGWRKPRAALAEFYSDIALRMVGATHDSAIAQPVDART